MGFASRMIAAMAANEAGWVSKMPGSNNMPTETKKSTAKASRKGSASAAAW